MGRKKKHYSTAELRYMLRGRRWTDFRFRRNTASRGRIVRRWLQINGVFFAAYVDKGLGPPSLKIKAKGQMVVLRFIDPELYAYLMINPLDNLRWKHLEQLPPVVGNDFQFESCKSDI